MYAQGAERNQVTVERYLVQLGFADQVQLRQEGDEVKVGVTMCKMTAKCSKHRDGWQEGPIPAGILSAFLDKLIPANAYSDIQSRNDGSFTFLSHESFCEPLLKASGTDGIFLKMHASQEKLELLWLDRQVSLSDTLAAATDKSVFGLAEKGQQGILALRFRIPMVTLYDLPKPTTSNKIWTCSDGKYQECPMQLGLSASPNCSQVSDGMCRRSYTRMMTMRYSQPRAMASLHQYISMLRTSHARSDSKHSMRLRDRRLQRMHKPADNSSVPPRAA